MNLCLFYASGAGVIVMIGLLIIFPSQYVPVRIGTPYALQATLPVSFLSEQSG